MRKNVRLILSVLMLVCVIGALVFGVIAITSENLGVANTTTYKFATENVFVEVSGEYSGPEIDEKYSKTYSDKVETDGETLENWTLGDIYLSYKEKTMSVTFCFKNLNVNNGLRISVSNYAYDSQGRIKSYYKTGSTKEIVDDAEDRVLIDSSEGGIGDLKLEKSDSVDTPQTIYLKLTFQAVKYNEDIEGSDLLDNSLVFTFSVA